MSDTGDSSTKGETHGRMVTLSDLRVFELKQELEKRGLDKNGIKLALIERLEAALRDEGNDPQEFLFSIADYGKGSTPAKAAPAVDEVTKEVNEKKVEETAEILVDEVTNEDGGGPIGEGQALLIDDGSGEGEKPVIELDDEDGKNDVDTEGETEEAGPEMEQEPEHEQEDEKEPLEPAMEVESVEDVRKDNGKGDIELGSGKRETVDKKEAENEMGVAEKVEKEEEMKMEGTGNEERDKEHVSEETKKCSAKAHIVGSSKTASTIKKTSNSLWIKGLGAETKAADLKAIFAKCGRVVTAKIFTRRQQPSSTCFGFVTMVDTAAAEECIRLFNKTHINGHLVSVERADHSSMPSVKPGQKKSSSVVAGPSTVSSSPAAAKEPTKNGEKVVEKRKSELKVDKAAKEPTKNGEKVVEKRKSELKVDKAEKHSEKKSGEEMKRASSSTSKAPSKSKKSPVEAPSKTDSEKARSSRETSKTHKQHSPPVFRKGRRVFERPTLHRTVRGGIASRKPARIAVAARGGSSYRGSFATSRARGGSRGGRILMSTRGRPLVSSVGRYERGSSMRHPSLGGRIGRPSMHDSYRDMPRRSVEAASWERREMMSMMRRREEEFRLKEEELKLQRERERIKFERERIERERLELEQLRQVAAMSGSIAGNTSAAMMMPQSRRSHGTYDEIDISSGRRGERSRSGTERSSSRHVAAYARGDRRESSRDDDMRARGHVRRADTERDRDRSRHVMRDPYGYGSSSVHGSRDYERPRRSDSYGRHAGESGHSGATSYGKPLVLTGCFESNYCGEHPIFSLVVYLLCPYVVKIVTSNTNIDEFIAHVSERILHRPLKGREFRCLSRGKFG
uniref:Scaffold attachment factor B2 n=1 Tax=Ascaris suum TaxID=6253 RepID=F1KVH9_ASCSU